MAGGGNNRKLNIAPNSIIAGGVIICRRQLADAAASHQHGGHRKRQYRQCRQSAWRKLAEMAWLVKISGPINFSRETQPNQRNIEYFGEIESQPSAISGNRKMKWHRRRRRVRNPSYINIK